MDKASLPSPAVMILRELRTHDLAASEMKLTALVFGTSVMQQTKHRYLYLWDLH